MSEKSMKDVLSAAGIPLKEKKCPERVAFKKHLEIPFGDRDKDWSKNLKYLKEQYELYFHDFLHLTYPHLLYEQGEDKVYWNYNEATGIYDEMAATSVRSIIIDLLFKEGMSDSTTEASAREILARYRAQYPQCAVKYDDFDSDDEWFHCKNGWLHTGTYEFIPHSPMRRSRRMSAVVYDKDATCPAYDAFLDTDLQLKKDQIHAIDQFSGLLLTPDISQQKMLTIIGKPGCGKSTLVEIWMKILADCATEKKLTSLTGESYRFAGSDLVGKTLCWFDEVDVKRAEMGTNLINLITGAHILIERKGINGITRAKNKVKCVLTANNLPRSVEAGAYRRMLLIPFTRSFNDDGVENKKIATILEKEMSGIFNRMLRGLTDLRESRTFVDIEGHEELIEDYKVTSDTVAEFLDTYFDPAELEYSVDSSMMFDAYKGFLGDRHLVYEKTCRQFSMSIASQSLRKFRHIQNSKRGEKNIRCWRGLTLKDGYEFKHDGLMMKIVDKTIF